MDEIRTWAPFAAVVISIATSVWQILSSPARTAQAGVDKLKVEVDAIGDRLARVEGDIQHLPDKETSHRMEMAIARLEGRLEVMDERLKPIASSLVRMQDHLMDGGGR